MGHYFLDILYIITKDLRQENHWYIRFIFKNLTFYIYKIFYTALYFWFIYLISISYILTYLLFSFLPFTESYLIVAAGAA